MHSSTNTSSCIRLLGVGVLVLGLSGLAFAQGPPQKPLGPCTIPPVWDEKIAGSERFVPVLDGEAYCDKETGLVWDKMPTDFGTWFIARSTCAKKKIGGRMGWRLPSLFELLSLIDPNSPNNTKLPTGHPFLGIQTEVYWSKTTSAEDPLKAFLVEFFALTIVRESPKTNDGELFWCVRGTMNADQY